MRNKSIRNTILTAIMAATILSVSGCQTSQTTDIKEKQSSKPAVEMSHSDEYILGEDGCNNFFLDGIYSMIIPSEEGYYFKKNGLLHYYDIVANKTVIVCSNPNCNHTDDENCNAGLYGCTDSIFHYKNNLYVIASTGDKNNVCSLVLTKFLEDGSEREDLYSFVDWADSDGISYEAYIHRGYLYYSIANMDGTKKDKIRIYRRALVKDATEEIFYESESYGGSIYCIRGYGNEIYFNESGFREVESDEYMELKKCNIHTKKAELVRENHYGYYEKIDDKVYFFDRDNEMLIEYSENTKEKRELCKVEKLAETDLKSDGQYLYLYCFNWKEDKKTKTTKKRVQILDLKGNLVDTLENTDEFIGGDDEYLFFKKYEDKYSEKVGQEVSTEHIYYYKKSDIGSGDYSLRTEMKPE